jgi:hypothetical protein
MGSVKLFKFSYRTCYLKTINGAKLWVNEVKCTVYGWWTDAVVDAFYSLSPAPPASLLMAPLPLSPAARSCMDRLGCYIAEAISIRLIKDDQKPRGRQIFLFPYPVYLSLLYILKTLFLIIYDCSTLYCWLKSPCFLTSDPFCPGRLSHVS